MSAEPSQEPDDERAALLDGYVEALERGEAVSPDAWAEKHDLPLDDELRGELQLLDSLFGAAQSIQVDASVQQTVPGRAGGKRAPSDRRFIEPGTRLGECEVVSLLGYGGMGEVYLARHTVLDREVAIKVLRSVLAEDGGAIDRFRDEVKSIAKLGPHPHVVGAMHAAEHEGRLYLVMEYVPGGDLHQLVATEGPIEPGRALRFIREAAAGLAHAHAAGLVHRDIKPSNLLLAPGEGTDGTIKVVDLGLARLTMDGRRSPHWADELVGSLDYMAPEQADDPAAADERSDLYSLGCTLYFLLAGKPPFAERLTLKKLMAHATQAPAPIEGVPAGLHRILDELLAKNPDERIQSAAELVDALDALDSGVQEPERPRSSTRDQRAAPEPVFDNAGAKGKARRLLGASVFAILAGLAIVALLLSTSREDPAPPEPEPRTLGVGEPFEGTLRPDDERLPKSGAFLDAYPVELKAGTTYIVTLSSRAFDPSLVLRSERGWEVATNDDAPGLGGTAQIVWTAENDDAMEVVATSEHAERTGAYLLSVTPLDDVALVEGEATEGTLSADSLRFHDDDTPMDRYWLPVTVGETYVVEMRSDAFRPATFVMSDQGNVLQAGGPLDETSSRVVYNATETGVVFVVANVAEGTSEGAYTLTLQSVLAGELVFDETGLLTDGDEHARDDSFYDAYPLEVEAGRTYVISMESEDFDTYLLLVDADDERIAANDDAIGTDSRLVWRAERTQSLRVFANSYAAGMTGEYRVRARELPSSGETAPEGALASDAAATP
ncbi:MAG: serine/threonine protein kinase [Deltaproteobacteria bacterium]|nr:serine/threonine protein kinase [Deltaproteobacteria bacterium]